MIVAKLAVVGGACGAHAIRTIGVAALMAIHRVVWAVADTPHVILAESVAQNDERHIAWLYYLLRADRLSAAFAFGGLDDTS